MARLGGTALDKIFGMMTDLTFRKVATPHLAKLLYVTTLVLSVLQAVLAIVGGFASGIAAGVISLVAAPVVAFFLMCAVRIMLETAIALQRSTNYLAELARAQRPEVAVPASTVQGQTGI